MGEQTRRTETNNPVVHVDRLFHAQSEKTRTGIRVDFSLRMLAGLFCAGMFVGTLGKCLVLGVGESGAGSLAQMDGGLLNTPMVHGAASRVSDVFRAAGARMDLRQSASDGWSLHFSAAGRITSVTKD